MGDLFARTMLNLLAIILTFAIGYGSWWWFGPGGNPNFFVAFLGGILCAITGVELLKGK